MKTTLGLGLAAAVLLAGCDSAGPPKAPEGSSGADPRFAGLEQSIRDWRAEIVRSETNCKSSKPGEGCQGFEVACKAERAISPAERAQGVSAKVVAGISWFAWDADRGEQMPVARFAQFTNTRGNWSRSPPLNGNLTTCETYEAKPA